VKVLAGGQIGGLGLSTVDDDDLVAAGGQGFQDPAADELGPADQQHAHRSG
jgi:hypothetical protein